jgi:hypothetical protein
MADGRVAIPAGSRAIGSVTAVERGGKFKERARLGIRFHTLVLADGTELPIRTESIVREGESPSGDSSRKIGGAAIGGAVLGAGTVVTVRLTGPVTLQVEKQASAPR